MLKRQNITFNVSGVQHTVQADEIGPETTLNTYLREKAQLTGTKRMCLEGGCGTCTVAVEETVNGKKNVLSVKSCLVSILSCHGWNIHTIEGIGNKRIGYHQIQKILSDNYGTQCGFCSPGMVMNMFALKESGQTTKQQIEDSFGGNICRCTGYRPILHAFQQLATNEEKLPDIEELKLCKKDPTKKCYDVCKKKDNYFLEVGAAKWMKVHTVNDLLELLNISDTSNYILVAGNTARGVYKNGPTPNLYIDIKDVLELTTYSINAYRLKLGANVTLTNFMNICNQNSGNNNFSFLSEIAKHIALVATVQIRNVGTIAGNLMIKHQHNEFPSDIFLLLETFNATLVIVDVYGNEYFYTPQNFLKLDMNKKIIKSIILNALDISYVFATYKIMPRAQNAHAMVNAGFLFKLNNNLVQKATIVYGGIHPLFIHAVITEKLLIGQNLYSNVTLSSAYNLLTAEINPDYILPDPTPQYRKQLALALFYKFALRTCPPSLLGDRYKSGGTILERSLSRGSQDWGATNKSEYPVTQPVLKLGSLNQTSGQAEFIMDMPVLPREVYASFVTTKAKAGTTIAKIDPSEALKLDGVIAFYDKNDIPGDNNYTPLNKSINFVTEELFCSGVVQFYYQPIGIIVAKTQELAWKASELVKVIYGFPQYTPYLNVKDVVKDNVKSRINEVTNLVPKTKGTDIQKVIKGEFYSGHQYHFHMELQTCLVIPKEDEFDVYATTQWMDLIEIGIASVLGIPNNKINVYVKRLGGGFGGKISRTLPVSAAVSLAAYKLNLPVRMSLSLEQNMNILGKRFPHYIQYEVGVNNKGVIQYMETNVYCDYGVGGNEPTFLFFMPSFESCYDISTWDISYYTVKTDTHANTYARAPGSIVATAAIEGIMERIAYTLNLDPFDVKKANLNPVVVEIPKYIEDLQTWAKIDKRKQEYAKFNKENRWKKIGFSIVPMKWMLSYAGNFTTLVSILHGDGSVDVVHGGVEIGQGINTKVAQVCAYKLGISLEQVSVKTKSNYILPNNFVTGGSITSEAVCYSTIRACDILIDRMKPIKDQMTNPSWPELVKKCYDSNIELSTTGFFPAKLPNLQEYPIYGICAAAVEVDILTGQHQILQVDIIEDLGESMSPIIDIGQVEGAFIFGLGFHTTEEVIYDKDGKLLTNRTWTYKPPGAKDIPINFRVKFASNSTNPLGVLNSKGVGEPPSCLSAAVPLAIKNAIALARKESDAKSSGWTEFDGPTTVEKTFLSCLNKTSQYILK